LPDLHCPKARKTESPKAIRKIQIWNSPKDSNLNFQKVYFHIFI
jgi:hypothetical protein